MSFVKIGSVSHTFCKGGNGYLSALSMFRVVQGAAGDVHKNVLIECRVIVNLVFYMKAPMNFSLCQYSCVPVGVTDRHTATGHH